MTVSVGRLIANKSLTINSTASSNLTKPKAFLLGASGEKLKTFYLINGDNELSMKEFSAGTYTLRIEAGNEVIVNQIIIS
ncbi:MAG: hypothetical protein ABIP80_01885 [Ferruginibacter sp.]